MSDPNGGDTQELGPAQDLTSTWPNMNISAPKATLFSHLLRRVPCCQNTDMLHGITYWRLFVLFSCSLPTGVQTPGSYFEATLCQPLIPRRSYTLACEAFAQ